MCWFSAIKFPKISILEFCPNFTKDSEYLPPDIHVVAEGFSCKLLPTHKPRYRHKGRGGSMAQEEEKAQLDKVGNYTRQKGE